MTPAWAWPVLAAAAGLALGSYAVTAAIRYSRSEPTGLGRSHCDACGCQLGFATTVPVFSYAMLKGACGSCGARIDPTHLAGEMAGALILSSALTLNRTPAIVVAALLGFALLAAAVIDWKIRRLPNALTAVVGLAAVLLAALRSRQDLAVGSAWAAALGLVLLGVRAMSSRLRGDPGLGLGDVKLMAALAVWLGPMTPWMLVGASVLGLAATPVVRPQGARLPFGPAIGLAAWIVGIATEWGLGRG